jgi:hypothetical protein
MREEEGSKEIAGEASFNRIMLLEDKSLKLIFLSFTNLI